MTEGSGYKIPIPASLAPVPTPSCALQPLCFAGASAIIPFPLSPHPRMPPPLCFAGAGCSDSASPIQSNLQESLDSSGGHRVLSWTRSLTRFAEYFADLERGYLGFSGIEQGDTDA